MLSFRILICWEPWQAAAAVAQPKTIWLSVTVNRAANLPQPIHAPLRPEQSNRPALDDGPP
jgi:hypothetical protein